MVYRKSYDSGRIYSDLHTWYKQISKSYHKLGISTFKAAAVDFTSMIYSIRFTRASIHGTVRLVKVSMMCAMYSLR